jgi:AcrR family transcriptional regulator
MTAKASAVQRERLTRERVVEAALRIMDTDGLEAVTMRRVAREVGVEAMSLYNHVEDKDDLMRGVQLRVFQEFGHPSLEPDDPVGNVRRVARAWRDLLRRHPHMLELLAEGHGPPSSPEALQPMETALAVLGDVGVPENEVVEVFHVFGGYIQGVAMMEQQMGLEKPGAMADLVGQIDPAELPCVTAALPYMAGCDIDRQFELGLDLMIHGMRARYGGHASGES